MSETPVPATEPAPAEPKPYLFVATPCYGGLSYVVFNTSLLKLAEVCRSEGIKMDVWQQGGESLIPRGRNYAVHEFLKSQATHLLFIDADIEFDPEDVGKLMRSGLEVVAGAYPLKRIEMAKVKAALERGEPDPLHFASQMVVHAIDDEENERGYVEGLGDCIEVKECGTGFMLLERSVIERFISHYRDTIEYDSDDEPDRKIHAVFHLEIVDDWRKGKRIKRYLSEDYWFCRKWREMGGKVFLHLGVKLGHMGMHLHRGDPHSVHGGPKKGICALPEDAERVRSILGGGTAVPEGSPRLIVDHAAKEGAFAVWAGLKYPHAVFDLYEPDAQRAEMLRQNFAMYGLRGQVRTKIDPAVTFQAPYWRVNSDGQVEVVSQ